jgi:hypothetical protein
MYLCVSGVDLDSFHTIFLLDVLFFILLYNVTIF